MSIHHEVSINCDGCGWWEYGSERTTAQRRKAGWRDWTTGPGRYGHRRHLCPNCTETQDGETPPVLVGGTS